MLIMDCKTVPLRWISPPTHPPTTSFPYVFHGYYDCENSLSTSFSLETVLLVASDDQFAHLMTSNV